MRIVIAGGAGDLGGRVVVELTRRGHDAVSASRRSGVDLTTGEGLAEVLVGADAVVNCVDHPRRGKQVIVDGSRRLADAVAGMALPVHLVHVSIVGCDLSPFRYYRQKTAAEEAVQASGACATVQRATQFHSLAAFTARTLSVGPASLTVGDLSFQPVDTDWVASRLVDLAVGPAPTAYRRAVDIAGPDVFRLGELAALVRAHAGQNAPRVVRIPPVGRLMRAFSEGTNVPAPGTADLGGRTFREWLHQQPRRLSGR